MPIDTSKLSPETVAALKKVLAKKQKQRAELAPRNAPPKQINISRRKTHSPGTKQETYLSNKESKTVPINTAGMSPLSERQLLAIDLIVDRQEGETNEDIAEMLEITRPTLEKWLKDPVFSKEIEDRITTMLDSNKGRVTKALVDGSTRRGSQQAQFMKLFYDRTDNKTNKPTSTSTVINNTNISTFPVHLLRPETKRMILEDLKAANFGDVDQGLPAGNELTSDSEGVIVEAEFSRLD